jgi:hypothetical protein
VVEKDFVAACCVVKVNGRVIGGGRQLEQRQQGKYRKKSQNMHRGYLRNFLSGLTIAQVDCFFNKYS